MNGLGCFSELRVGQLIHVSISVVFRGQGGLSRTDSCIIGITDYSNPGLALGFEYDGAFSKEIINQFFTIKDKPNDTIKLNAITVPLLFLGCKRASVEDGTDHSTGTVFVTVRTIGPFTMMGCSSGGECAYVFGRDCLFLISDEVHPVVDAEEWQT